MPPNGGDIVNAVGTTLEARPVVPETLSRIREAFQVFEAQSSLLQVSYNRLEEKLARSNQQLNAKNAALSAKIAEVERMTGRLESVLESMADSVLVVNRDLSVDRCNQAAEVLLHRDRADILGRQYRELTNGLGNEDALRAAVMRGESSLEQLRRHNTTHDSPTVVLASVAPMRCKDGTIFGAVEILRDVTELHRLQERINCQQRMAALGEMAACVAHEIRNPLGTIEGFARLLKRDLETQPEHARLASKIVEGAQNLNYVITNLLTYARPMTLQIEAFPVLRLAEEVREALRDRAGRAGVTVTIASPPPTAMAKADIRQLRQVLVNLGLNAIEACKPGGRVQLDIVRDHRHTVFTFTDTGCGIAEADLPRIFDPFFTRKQGGTGLGLSLSHKIVEAHGGDIRAENSPGRGATFTVTMPDTKEPS